LLNCAAHTGVDACENETERANSINGQGPGNLSQLCREYSAKLVHFSTDFVFNGQSDRPYRPDDAPSPISAYGRSKLLGEEAIQKITPLAWLIIRTAWLFGRHGNCFPKIIVRLARAGSPLEVVNDQAGCPTYAVDLSFAVLDLLDRGANGIWHVTNSSPTTWYDFARAIVSEFNLPAEVKPITTAAWVARRPQQAKRPAYSVLDLSPAHALLGRKMRDWRDALRDYRTLSEFNSSGLG
jgi:dTDP-4-dehydrorhamnose reductase